MEIDELFDDLKNLPEKITSDLEEKISKLYCDICNISPQVNKTSEGLQISACEHLQEAIANIVEQG